MDRRAAQRHLMFYIKSQLIKLFSSFSLNRTDRRTLSRLQSVGSVQLNRTDRRTLSRLHLRVQQRSRKLQQTSATDSSQSCVMYRRVNTHWFLFNCTLCCSHTHTHTHTHNPDPVHQAVKNKRWCRLMTPGTHCSLYNRAHTHTHTRAHTHTHIEAAKHFPL